MSDESSSENSDQFSGETQVKSPKLDRRNSSGIWLYVKKVKDGVQCNQPNCSKLWSKKTGNSSIITHLFNHHEIIVIEKHKTSEVEPKKTTRRKLDLKKQELITSFFIKFIICSLQTFSLCNDSHFLTFINAIEPRYVVPDRKTAREYISKLFETSIIKIKNKLSSLTQKVCVILYFTVNEP